MIHKLEARTKGSINKHYKMKKMKVWSIALVGLMMCTASGQDIIDKEVGEFREIKFMILSL